MLGAVCVELSHVPQVGSWHRTQVTVDRVHLAVETLTHLLSALSHVTHEHLTALPIIPHEHLTEYGVTTQGPQMVTDGGPRICPLGLCLFVLI